MTADENDKLEWLKKASPEDLLRKWRFEPLRSPWFFGEVGKTFSSLVDSLHKPTNHDDFIKLSKLVGYPQFEDKHLGK